MIVSDIKSLLSVIIGALHLKVSQSKWGQTVAKVKLKRSQSVDILTLSTVWPLYPVLSLSLAPLPRVYLQFIQAYPHNIITLSAVWHSRLTPSPSLTVLWQLGLLITEVWQLTVVTLNLWPHSPFWALDLKYHVMLTNCTSSVIIYN